MTNLLAAILPLMQSKQRANYPHSIMRFLPLRLFCLFLCLLFLSCSEVVLCRAATNDGDSRDASSKVQIKIRRLQHGIDAQNDEILLSAEQERNILDELEGLDKKLTKQQFGLEALEVKMLRQEGLIAKEERILGAMYTKKGKAESHLQKRMSAYYTMGKVGFLNVTFSTKTLPELLRFRDSFESLIEYDKRILLDYKKTIDELERVKAALDLERSILQDFIDLAKQKSDDLQATTTEKSTLLKLVRTKTQLHKQAIREMVEASEELSRSLVDIKNKKNLKAQIFRRHKGKIILPMDGLLITEFQQLKKNKLGIEQNCQGIEFTAANGTDIVAVEKGEVVFSGYLRGYGNTVIINHGFKYVTVTSRIEKILVSKGDTVNSRDIIGEMGDTATLFDEGLYFEIRLDNKAVDPLLWLDPDKIVRKTDKQESNR